MAKVLNTTNRSLPVERWTLLANSTKCIDRQGSVRNELPDAVAYGPVVKHYTEQGLVTLDGIAHQKIEKPEIEAAMYYMSKSQRKKLREQQKE
ncbi:hypothetical protein UFOVP276_52 [uncultured Caudovirales phage]|uniref:Uncharacterized protein n=1 Tax=uncultured Caudovirales phage TaxID=2100421 RepID=A0A6J5LKD0_9CAUD|nr:hypothetical protein UFOVP127_189 [uncultured Caudovirales phage]CAB4135038.1 hypothetical protein UFOVP276_52 [uncultured Caudovirales phage]